MKYNGFNNEEDYQFVLNIVENIVNGNTKIHTYAVNMDEKNDVVIILNDVRVRFEHFRDLMCLAKESNVKLNETSDIKSWVDHTITKHLVEVIKKEGWK